MLTNRRIQMRQKKLAVSSRLLAWVCSSWNCGSALRVAFACPTIFDSTGSNRPFDLITFPTFLLQLRTVSLECIDCYLKSEIQTEQKAHLQPVELRRAYPSHSRIVCIVEKPAKHNGMKWCKMGTTASPKLQSHNTHASSMNFAATNTLVIRSRWTLREVKCTSVCWTNLST